MNIHTLKSSCRLCLRNYSKSASKLKVVPDEHVVRGITDEVYKPRKHPGIMQTKTVVLPDTFVKAVSNSVEDYPVKALIETSRTFVRHLKGRVPPMEQIELKETRGKVQENLLRKYKDVIIKDTDDETRFNQMIKDKINKILREKVYNWKPIKYDVFHSLVYLFGRSAAEYAVLIKLFGEISHRDPIFKPKSLFDFGSGVGTGTWAANMYWKKDILEYFNVDASGEMNDLAQMLLQGGKGTGSSIIKGTFYRQFLPASNISYDLVICAYSLLELPSLETRLEVILNLWNKTQNYLVVVEQGTNAGFKVVNEVRDFILQIDSGAHVGHAFSPCPHDSVCPRYLNDDGTPCNFEVSYFSLPVGQHSQLKRELYSYIILKKGKRYPEDPKWPRIVRQTLVRSKHSICRLCTSDAKLEEIVFTASKHGKLTYHCARSSKWGDLLPISVEENKSEEYIQESNSSEIPSE